MGRWTPLILMAGGLAILLGTLLGINFPMGVQSANAPGGKAAKVLPANINVNSSAGSKNEETATEGNETTETNENKRSIVPARPDNRSNVAQNPSEDSTSPADSTTENNTDSSATETPSSNTNQGNEPIRALW
ncbi:hypothetical protein CDG77_20235 [Nostoc sp. 'Peltigera membranacea cyanobiont' 213]|uniref:hypothetical protein n=1 Tax=unclassified Nostoc TaxID=2593658 RepID=UPI000B9582E9|nr:MULTISPECIES: hypothetical protein [unclassified Nostoc]AVH67502.1 hypothetical protein NPM_6097 [Nostoc sp. 'Peltigera membranacea cyanobiont' N6]OYD89061.1 hypothetical protein CDG77_20235 [Nostoc sp. 'Peltigera membranacea cyanobiont' 213]